MNIRNRRELTSFAAERLSNAPQEKTIVLIYAGVAIGLNLVTVLLNYVLGLCIDQSGGLSKMATRTMLSTLQNMLPLVQMMVLMCLDLGYRSTMLRTARGQYASPNGLRLGFDRFWVLLRHQILITILYMGICIAGVYASTMIFLMTPLSEPAMDLLMPLAEEASVLNPQIVLTDEVYGQLMQAMTPLLVMSVVVVMILFVPLGYRFRMSRYVLIDHPGKGALKALRESRKMMRGNILNMFKLDLYLWWYYAAMAGATALLYADQLLPLLGVEIPVSGEISYFLCYGLYWAAEFAVYYFLRNRVEVTCALAYDTIKPEEPKDNGVVLGNIFQM